MIHWQNVVPSVTNEVGSLFPGLAALPQVKICLLCQNSNHFLAGGSLNIWRVCLIIQLLLFKWR